MLTNEESQRPDDPKRASQESSKRAKGDHARTRLLSDEHARACAVFFDKKLPPELLSYINDFVDIDSRIRSVFLVPARTSGPRSRIDPRFNKLRGLFEKREAQKAGAIPPSVSM